MPFLKPSYSSVSANSTLNTTLVVPYTSTGTKLTDAATLYTTAGTAHTWGSWVVLDVLDYPTHLFELSFPGVSASAASSYVLFELSYVIGGNRTTCIEKSAISARFSYEQVVYPIYIPEGASVEIRFKSNRTSVVFETVFVSLGPVDYITPFSFCRSVGITDDASNSRGTSVADTVGSYGTPVTLGTTDVDAYAFRLMPSYGPSTTVLAATYILAKVNISAGADIGIFRFTTDTGEALQQISPVWPIPRFIPSGTVLQVAPASNAAVADYLYSIELFYGPR